MMQLGFRNILSIIHYHLCLNLYRAKLPFKVKQFRRKEKIKVLYIISDLDSWKTEMLYCQMERHPRFLPIVGVSTNAKYPYAKDDIIKYLQKKQYRFIDLDISSNSILDANPDIIFYGTPYASGYTKGHYFNDNLKFVFCGVDYCFNITKHEAHLRHKWYDYCWQFYVEHEDVRRRKKELLGYLSNNIKVTGVPLQDTLLLPKEKFEDPWKDKSGKKRIIYAPHHSFEGSNGDGIEFSTFLEYGEILLEFAKKYEQEVSIAFKPHPFLYIKLIDIWGKERTDNYYKEWESLSNTQFENGEYIGLFKYSDAIIHDCASFILEYLYTDNPSMYLVSKNNRTSDMFDFVREGFNCYEHGRSIDDIECFINNVIKGIDNKKNERQLFIKNQLVPPGRGCACDNIIHSILFG